MKIFPILEFCLCYFFSFFLYQYVEAGDLQRYAQLYEVLSTVTWTEVPETYFNIVGGTELGYGYLMWLFAHTGIAKNFVLSFFNAILLCSLSTLLKKYRVEFVPRILIFTNYYLILILLNAERFKFAVLLSLIAITYLHSTKRTLVLASSILFHLQMIPLLAGVVLSQYYQALASFLLRLKYRITHLIAIPIIIATLPLIIHLVTGKFGYYSAISNGLSETYGLIFLCFLTSYLTKNYVRIPLLFAPLLIACYFVGSDRVNVMGFFLAFYEIMLARKTSHFGSLTMLGYLSIKSVPFLNNLITTGSGF